MTKKGTHACKTFINYGRRFKIVDSRSTEAEARKAVPMYEGWYNYDYQMAVHKMADGRWAVGIRKK